LSFHVAIIMDGNGRWARERGLPRIAGHREGANSVRNAVEAAPDLGIDTLTLYAFSEDNWSRPPREVAALMKLLGHYLVQEQRRCIDNGVKLEAIGRRDRLGAPLVGLLERTERATAAGRRLHLRLAIDYSSRSAIVEAARRIQGEPTEEKLSAQLGPDVDLLIRTSANWALGVAYQLQGNRAAARVALTEAISLGQAAGNLFTTILATLSLGDIQVAENKLSVAMETYRRVLHLLGDPPLPVASEAHLGLARIFYEWNDLDAAERHGRQSLHLARQYGRVIDRFIICEVFLARLKLAQGDVASASALLVEASQSARERHFVQRVPEVAAVQVLTLLRQGNLADAAQLAESHDLPISQARVHLARGDPSAALAVLNPVRQQMEAKGWEDERLKLMVLEAVAYAAHGDKDTAVHVLGDALALAGPGGFVRLFVDEGPPMAALLAQSVEHRAQNASIRVYAERLLSVFPEAQNAEHRAQNNATRALRSALERSSAVMEPLSERELEVLQYFAEGLSNQEIASRLYLSPHTVKVHSRNIYGKLGVHNRMQAVARARALGMLPAV